MITEGYLLGILKNPVHAWLRVQKRSVTQLHVSEQSRAGLIGEILVLG